MFLCFLIIIFLLLFKYIFKYKNNFAFLSKYIEDNKGAKAIEELKESIIKKNNEEFKTIENIKEYKGIKIFEEQDINYYKQYIDDCYNLKVYNRKNIKNETPFVSICLAVYNMEKYIESTLLSILNQSFQDFEIIVVNDFSNDNTLKVLEKFKSNDKIKIINHSKNLGVYASRVDGVRNSKGKFVITMDPDDMFLNPGLLYNLYIYNIEYNLDIIEFNFMKYNVREKNLEKDEGHFHLTKIVHQPELSNMLFYFPGTKQYASVRCRVIWNKLIRKEVLLKSYDYLGEDFYNELIITAEDTLVNIINLQYANNFTFTNYTGYMYNMREESITRGNKDIKQRILFHENYLLYLKKLHTFIQDYNKDRNYLFYELKVTNDHLTMLYSFNSSKKEDINKFYEGILEDNNTSKQFREYITSYLK